MKRLFIDLEICHSCHEKDCPVKCSYYYHPGNNGVDKLREEAHFFIVCRHCEEEPCVTSCPVSALEKQKNGLLKRYLARCIRCQSCVYACPFGTMYSEFYPYAVSNCDFCIDRCNSVPPLCVQTCQYGALKFIEVEEDPQKDIYAISENLVAHSILWPQGKEKYKK